MSVPCRVALLLAVTLCCGATADVFASEHDRRLTPCEMVDVLQEMSTVFEALSEPIMTVEKMSLRFGGASGVCVTSLVMRHSQCSEKKFTMRKVKCPAQNRYQKAAEGPEGVFEHRAEQEPQLRSAERGSNFSDFFQTCNNTMPNNERTKEDLLRAIGEGWGSVLAWASGEKSRLEAEENEAMRASLGSSSQASSEYKALLTNFMELVGRPMLL
ncbi:hypothetical protein ERJ75_000404900 [Trypanosoma vivax]|nr:hypothetical protein ERJ75_000404900 [Trypanosoma vivax]